MGTDGHQAVTNETMIHQTEVVVTTISSQDLSKELLNETLTTCEYASQVSASDNSFEEYYALRDKLMQEIIENTKDDPDSVRVIQEYEATMRRRINKYYEYHTPEESIVEIQGDKPMTFLEKLRRFVFFEEAYIGYATLTLYCIAHVSCWEICTALLYECIRNVDNQNKVNVILMISSLCVLRISGGIFSWIPSEAHERAQVKIRHGLRKSCLDAQLIQWFRRHSTIKTVVNTLSFYVFWVGVAYFQAKCLGLVDKRSRLLQSLPSAAHEQVTTTVKERLQYSIALASGGGERSLAIDVDNSEKCMEASMSCPLIDDLEAKDDLFASSELSVSSYYQWLGDDSIPLVSTTGVVLIYSITAIVSILILYYKLGHSFGRD